MAPNSSLIFTVAYHELDVARHISHVHSMCMIGITEKIRLFNSTFRAT